MGSVAGKVALITGAASGLGLASATLLADEGATVVLTDIDEKGVQAAAKKIGRGAIGIPQDVTDEAGWKRIIGEVETLHGRLDILLNNAGLLRFGSVEDSSLEDFQLIQSVMVEGVFLGCKHAIPLMTKGSGGSIINMSSTAALQGYSPIIAYAAAKGAVRSMTKSIAIHCQEKGYGIRCNSIHPGKIQTGLVQKCQPGTSAAARAKLRGAAVGSVRRRQGCGAPGVVSRLAGFAFHDRFRAGHR